VSQPDKHVLMADIRFLSEPKRTTVTAEAPGFHERAADERLHFHEAGETCCQVCFAAGVAPWTDSEELFDRHAARCGERVR
jgi:hypothetical protein